jgi:hypothetical protein
MNFTTNRIHAARAVKSLLTITLGVLLCAAAGAQSLSRLKTWANESPIDYTSRPRRNIFADPGVRRALLKVETAAEFDRMVKQIDLVVPVDLVGGYLLISGHSRADDEDYLIALRLSDGSAHVRRTSAGAAGEWKGGRPALEDCVLDRY